ncbi:PEGA domain-containing protein [Bacteroidota bacterium]
MNILRGILIILIVSITACRDNIVEFEEEGVRSGKIYVYSSPVGADIYWNNWYMYKSTPDSLTRVYPGIHKVLLKQQGYRDTTITVYIQEGDIGFVNVTLTSLMPIMGD